MNYFEYNENRYARKPGETSKTQMDVIEAPAYWVTEHGEIDGDLYERFAAQFQGVKQAIINSALRELGFPPVMAAGYGPKTAAELRYTK